MRRHSFLPAAITALALGGCSVAQEVASVGRAPRFSKPTEVPAPVVEPSIAAPASSRVSPPSASLFREGAAGLFHDQRARARGDLLTIRVRVDDNAALDNRSERRRGGTESAGIAGLLGIDKLIDRIVPGPAPSASVDGSSDSRSAGEGRIERGETINLTLAAIVTEVLPNGNLVVRGRQEMQVNNELRELVITGIVRPADVARDNSIRHHQIAEARVLYGGRGQLSSAQSARWGQQLYDALFPF
jgi:flagellar L-ring protein precursor FlgH